MKGLIEMTNNKLQPFDFEVIDFVADATETVITVELHKEAVERFETFTGSFTASINATAVANVRFNNDDVVDGVVRSDTNHAEILNAEIKVQILDNVIDEIYDDVQEDITSQVLESLKTQRFEVRIDRDE